MHEPPIRAQAVVHEVIKPELCVAKLPNGKLTTAHLSKALKKNPPTLNPDDHIELELTPYDFDTARIRRILSHSPTN